METKKALLMRSYNPADVAEVMKVTDELIKEVKETDEVLITDFENDEFKIKQWLYWNGEEDYLAIWEEKEQTNEVLKATIQSEVKLQLGQFIVKTEMGYMLVRLSMKVLTEEELELVDKYNELGGK